MGTRGRNAQQPLNVVSIARSKPPAELTGEQAEVWNQVVNSLPADWFTKGTYPLLVEYCRHVVSSRRVQQLIQAAEQGEPDDESGELYFDVEGYDRLLKMAERESRIIASLAVKMRVSQSTYYDERKKRPGASKPPWESG
jgi:hypothetical protein